MRGELKLFESSWNFASDPDFPYPGVRCELVFWTARWTVSDEQHRIDAIEEYPGHYPEGFEIEEYLLPEGGSGGLLGGMGCRVPAFRTTDELQGRTVQISYEYQYFNKILEPEPEQVHPAPIECGSYTYNDSLPIHPCSEGLSVRLFQEALGLNADGYFGPGTQSALLEYQRAAHLPVTGNIDAATWAHVGPTQEGPGDDLNGDGVIDGSEMILH